MNTALKLVLALAVIYVIAKVSPGVDEQASSSAQASAAVTDNAPPGGTVHHLDVLSIVCVNKYNRPRAEVAVQNTGASTIEFAKAVVSFGGSIHDSYLDPNPIRPDGIATATIYAEEGESKSCSLVAIQDRYGYAAKLYDRQSKSASN